MSFGREICDDPLTRYQSELVELHDRVRVPFCAHAANLAVWQQNFQVPGRGVLVRDASGHLCGAALLSVQRGLGSTRLTLTGHGWADHQAIAFAEPAAAGVLAAGIVQVLHDYPSAMLQLEQMRPSDPVVEQLGARLEQVRLVPGDLLPMRVWPRERTENGWGASRMRRKARSLPRKVEEAGHRMQIDRHREADAVMSALTVANEVRRRREIELGRVDDLSDPRWANLERAVVRRHAVRGEAEVWLLHIDDEPAAYNVAIRDDGVMRLWDGRIVGTWRQFNPGAILHMAELQQWYAEGIDRVDFMRGMNQSKRQVCNMAQATVELTAWSSARTRRVQEGLATASEATRQQLRDLRDRSPLFADAVSQVRAARTSWQARRGHEQQG